ncbi:MAG: DnaJ domain-containing protein [Trueperaceae bacterium]|nr:DnaJ domain-containing protein [Trueperaceae bacterium]
MAAFKDYYDILGVARSADEKQVRSAFRKLAAKHHPDRNRDDPTAEERFKEVNEAYTVLSDPEKRRVYDQYGPTGAPPPPPPGGGGRTVFTTAEGVDAEGFSDFFRTLFGGAYTTHGTAGGDPFGTFGTGRMTRGGRPVDVRPPSAEATLEIDLVDAYKGGVRTLRLEGTTLDVTLPAAARDGSRLRLRGQAPGGGDLILRIRHRAHQRYRLEGDTIHVQVDVPDHLAVLGGEVRVPTLDGDVEMRLPPGSQTGRRLRLRGRGWPRADGARGDAQAEVRVVVPTEPDPEVRALYERLRALAGGTEAAPEG